MGFRVPGLQTVSVVQRSRRKNNDDTWARDDRGNAVYDDVVTDVAGCSVQPSASNENTVDGRDQVSSTYTIYAPSTFPGGAIDAVKIDGQSYEIVGEPQRWRHPRLAHTVVTVRAVGG